ncbi:MAG: integrase core domain-containing protein [Propionibacteriaceae bacterium]|nr:integrase core domain-containing protein [Propionibacteriaceae bacterium]
MDACSHRIVGWRTTDRMPVDLPLDMALWARADQGWSVAGVTHHSGSGNQYTSICHGRRLEEVGALASVGSVGDSYDNAMAESVIGLYKTERVRLDGPFKTVGQLELATCDWVDYHNRRRVHSSIRYATPIEHENQRHHDQQQGQPATR